MAQTPPFEISMGARPYNSDCLTTQDSSHCATVATTIVLTLRTDRVELMKFLLDEGFDVNIVEDGKNTFDCALKQGLRHTPEVLVKKKAQPHLRIWRTESPEVTRWKDESWFPQLLEIISKHNFSVSTFLNSGLPFTVRASRGQYHRSH